MRFHIYSLVLEADGSWVQPKYVTCVLFPHLAFFEWPVTTLSYCWNVKALALLKREHRILATNPYLLQPGAPLFAIRVCLLLAVHARWLCGRIWMSSRSIVVQAGGSFPQHVAAIKKRKEPCSKGPLSLPVLSKIPQSRCCSNWTNFRHLRELSKEGGIFPAAMLRTFFMQWIMRFNIFLSISQLTSFNLIVHCGISSIYAVSFSRLNPDQNKYQAGLYNCNSLQCSLFTSFSWTLNF